MDLQQAIKRSNNLPRKQLSELASAAERHSQGKNLRKLSEPKPRMNLIKINKNKLPLDFFLRKEMSARRHSNHKTHFQQQYTEPLLYFRKADSERVQFTPEKTSFFNLLEAKEPVLQTNKVNRFFSRKFQTRQEPKRELFPLEPTRKLNTATKCTNNELLELFPPTYNNQLNEFLHSSSKTPFIRATLRRETLLKQRQPMILQNPEKPKSISGEEEHSVVDSKESLTTRDRLNSHNLSVSENSS